MPNRGKLYVRKDANQSDWARRRFLEATTTHPELQKVFVRPLWENVRPVFLDWIKLRERAEAGLASVLFGLMARRSLVSGAKGKGRESGGAPDAPGDYARSLPGRGRNPTTLPGPVLAAIVFRRSATG